MASGVAIGLCERCAWSRQVPATQSTFVLCTRGLSDPAYRKYPPLPVLRCPGYQATGPRPPSPEDIP